MKYIGAIIGAGLGKWIAYQWIVYELAFRYSRWRVEGEAQNFERIIKGAYLVRDSFLSSVWSSLVPIVIGIALASAVPKPSTNDGPAVGQGVTAVVVSLVVTLLWACWVGIRG